MMGRPSNEASRQQVGKIKLIAHRLMYIHSALHRGFQLDRIIEAVKIPTKEKYIGFCFIILKGGFYL